MGRTRKSIKLLKGHWTNSELDARSDAERQYKVARNALAPPSFLDAQAKKEFLRVVQEATAADFLDNLDLAALAMYANAWSHYEKLSRQLNKEGDIISVTDAKGNVRKRTNPALVPLAEYASQIFKCSTKLGLATTDRLKLVVPTKAPAKVNKFAKFFQDEA